MSLVPYMIRVQRLNEGPRSSLVTTLYVYGHSFRLTPTHYSDLESGRSFSRKD